MMGIQLGLTGVLDTTARTITFTGYTIDSPLRIELIWDVTTARTLYQWNNPAYIGSWNATNTVLTLNAGVSLTGCANTDLIQIAVADQIGEDVGLNVKLVSVQNSIEAKRTDFENIVTALNLTAAYADYGPEIDMKGFNTLGIWVTRDVNDSLNVNLKALAKFAYANAIEGDIDGISIVPLWTTVVADGTVYYEFDTGAIPFIQLQAIAGTVGATPGDLTIDICKFYK